MEVAFFVDAYFNVSSVQQMRKRLKRNQQIGMTKENRFSSKHRVSV
ncbi:hypothetical protein LEP1GSC193_1962 [Leptospira alstonii serovar Pingchang str. 80-412]|uniref:Uncharacterized protein n=2 Tax=Leptospira alstonii TaxID=28452 RepID=M6D531_9LEPT|nr:hypothetical protein LEP1GSC194_1731 [Leptospira alstonii serovar Sichuan str. 79601]EQA81530.1 hypothetical protein LEP1GSC193_1962 [Leptospira alstonii serovar Pingchang str. 80-412]